MLVPFSATLDICHATLVHYIIWVVFSFLHFSQESVSTDETGEAHIKRDLVETASLIKSPGYNLQGDDPGIFLDGDDFDKFVPERKWPDEALPSPPQPAPQSAPQPSSPGLQVPTASESTVQSLLKSHHLQADVLKSLGVDACTEYKKGKASYYLSQVRKGDVLCPLCNKRCSNSQKLKNHIRAKHQEVTSYQCTTCDKSFGDSFTLKTHIQTHKKPSSTKRLKCRICGRRCDTASHLVQQERDHTGEGGTCQYCGLHLVQSLPAHESSCKKNPANIETPRVKQHVCPDCNKAYFNRKDLNHHKIHHAPH